MSVYETVVDLPRKARTIHRIFMKRELQLVAEELNIEVGRKNTRQLVLDIVNDLEENGIPDSNDASDELFEFLLNLDFIDDDGNILEVSVEDIPEEIQDVTTKPECYSLADIRDPACKRCILMDECLEMRIQVRPNCFGELYDGDDEQCQGCIEAVSCKEVLSGSAKT